MGPLPTVWPEFWEVCVSTSSNSSCFFPIHKMPFYDFQGCLERRKHCQRSSAHVFLIWVCSSSYGEKIAPIMCTVFFLETTDRDTIICHVLLFSLSPATSNTASYSGKDEDVRYGPYFAIFYGQHWIKLLSVRPCLFSLPLGCRNPTSTTEHTEPQSPRLQSWLWPYGTMKLIVQSESWWINTFINYPGENPIVDGPLVTSHAFVYVSITEMEDSNWLYWWAQKLA